MGWVLGETLDVEQVNTLIEGVLPQGACRVVVTFSEPIDAVLAQSIYDAHAGAIGEWIDGFKIAFAALDDTNQIFIVEFLTEVTSWTVADLIAAYEGHAVFEGQAVESVDVYSLTLTEPSTGMPLWMTLTIGLAVTGIIVTGYFALKKK